MRVALVQHDVAWEDRSATLTRLEPQVAAAAATGARIVLLTELFAVGFSLDSAKVAEPPGGPTASWLGRRAAAEGVWLGGSVPTAVGPGRVRNRFTLCGPAGEVLTYDKVRPFTHGGEAAAYEGGEGTTSWTVEGLRVTPFVCFDLRFADLWWAPAPTTDLYVCVASWPASRRHHWRSLLVARAIENQAYVAACNRVGEGGGIAYAGDSTVVDPLGEVLATASSTETVVSAEVDPAHVAAVRDRFRFLADRR